jgi:hypothetical protein
MWFYNVRQVCRLAIKGASHQKNMGMGDLESASKSL